MPCAFELCYITDRRTLEPKPLLPLIQEAIRAGLDLVQIREKDLATRELLELVKGAVDAARGTSTRIVVNDRLDVALAAGAAGVHLGTQSLPARVVRQQVPKDFLVGVSCHTLEEALSAQSAGADYVVFGPIFETPSKLPYGPPLGLGKLREVTMRVKTPVLALGGITVERVRSCLEAGAAGIAGISIFQNCESLERRAQELRAELARRPEPSF
ncbi:MAG: thiamine phosphate synthase [Terriglobia bacterium]